MEQEGLFAAAGGNNSRGDSGNRGTAFFEAGASAPLAARMRPRTLDEIAGQRHLLSEGKPLRRLIDGSGAASVILYGPPGTGKTTIASLIASAMGQNFVALSALSSGVKEVRAVIDEARRDLIRGGLPLQRLQAQKAKLVSRARRAAGDDAAILHSAAGRHDGGAHLLLETRVAGGLAAVGDVQLG